jgi:hypothetical protein
MPLDRIYTVIFEVSSAPAGTLSTTIQRSGIR